MTSPSGIKLAPCPFCGAPDSHEETNEPRSSCFVACGMCGTQAPAVHGTNGGITAAREFWNRRPVEADLRAKLEAAEKCIASQERAMKQFIAYGEEAFGVKEKAEAACAAKDARIARLRAAMDEAIEGLLTIASPENMAAVLRDALDAGEAALAEPPAAKPEPAYDDGFRHGYIQGLEDFETEWYAAEQREGERPYGFDVAGIKRFLIEKRYASRKPEPAGGGE